MINMMQGEIGLDINCDGSRVDIRILCFYMLLSDVGLGFVLGKSSSGILM